MHSTLGSNPVIENVLFMSVNLLIKNSQNHMKKYRKTYHIICHIGFFILFLLQNIVIMRKYIHEHLNYDEIIDDETDNYEYLPKNSMKPSRERLSIVTSKEGKPFWLEKSGGQNSEEDEGSHAAEAEAEGFKKVMNEDTKEEAEEGQYKDDSFEEYQNDFQQFTESYYESLAKESKRPSSLLDYEKINLSANLPTLKKIQPRYIVRHETTIRKNQQSHRTQKDKKMSISLNSKTSRVARQKSLKPEEQQESKRSRKGLCYEKLNKSTIQLKRDNRDLLQKVNNLRDLLPQYRKNRQTLQLQKAKIDKLKQLEKRLFDVDYGYELEKAVQQSQNLQTRLRKVLQTKQRKIIRNDRRLIKIKKIPKPIEQEVPDKVFIVREDLLCKMRQDIGNEQKLIELNKKIIQYENIIQQLDLKIAEGSIEDLHAHIQQLKNSNMNKKIEQQSQTCKIISEITLLNQEISRTQIQIIKTGKLIKEQEPTDNNKRQIEKEPIRIDEDQKIRVPSLGISNKSPKNIRIFKFFKDKK